jgi:endonuclease/exonuclease/phosphatase family metal-dependent hydrolase
VQIRLLTYNVHKCVGTDAQYLPERIRDTVAHYEPDFLLLQEVSEGQKKASFHRQVDVIGGLLGLHHRTYFPNAKCLGGGRYGNAILSRYPVTEARNIELRHPLGKPRSVLHARFRLRRPGHGSPCTLHVFNAHLGLTQWLRAHQLRQFLSSRSFTHLDPRTPAVLAGDFNDFWGSVGRKFLQPAGFRPMPRKLRTFPSWAPIQSLDHIYVRGQIDLLEVRRVDHAIARRASDHLPVLADAKIG